MCFNRRHELDWPPQASPNLGFLSRPGHTRGVDPAGDLPQESITAVTLVDTQSLITIKGLSKKTRVFVIDHHTKKKNLPSDWEFNQVESGACTTFFNDR